MHFDMKFLRLGEQNLRQYSLMARSFFIICIVGFSMVACEERAATSLNQSESFDWKEDFPEMPGDEYERLSRKIQESGARSFLAQRFAFVESNINPLKGIHEVFDRASEASLLVRPYDEAIEIPELVFKKSLREFMENKNCSVDFGYRHGDTPQFSVREMLARLCVENQIEIISASPDRFEFGLRALPEVSNRTHPFAEAAEARGLRLHIVECRNHINGIRIDMINEGAKAIEVGLPRAAYPGGPWNPLCLWSLIPVEKSGIFSHPYGICEDILGAGCSTGWTSLTGEVLRIEPGKSVDITNQIGLPDVVCAHKVDGLFRAKLYFLNYAETPFRGAESYLSESERARIVSRLRRSLSCYLVSNEIQLEAVSLTTMSLEHEKARFMGGSEEP